MLRCFRYVDLNPVRARMIDDPAAYAWSSCAALCGAIHALLTHRPAYIALGASAPQRARAYRSLLDEVLSDDMIQKIRAYLQQQRALGRNDFRAMVEAKTCRFLGVRPAHRPRNPPHPPSPSDPNTNPNGRK